MRLHRQKVTPMHKDRRSICQVVFWLCEAFAVCTLFMMLKTGDPMKLCMCIGTMLLLCAPAIVERLFRCRISLPVYLFILLYAIGPMLGYCHNLYYLTCWWDNLRRCGIRTVWHISVYAFLRQPKLCYVRDLCILLFCDPFGAVGIL